MPESLDEILDAARDCHANGQIAAAVDQYKKALQIDPSSASTLYFLGLAVFQLHRRDEAVALIRRAIALDASVAEYHCDLSGILFAMNDLTGSIDAGGKPVVLRRDFPEALLFLGHALCKSGRFQDGIDAYQRVIALRPGTRNALNNLGMALFQLGRIEEALACFDRILALNPSDYKAHSNRIYTMHFSPAVTSAYIRRELSEFNLRHGVPLKAEIQPHRNVRSIDRPLRIGYVSADLREHVVGWNMLSWLPHHDRDRFHTVCYSNSASDDAVARQIRSCVRTWRDISQLSDLQAAQMIRDDEIDILVDLAVHTSGNRLLVFARKPAPIQVTYLGYPGITGLDAMDYRFSDPYLDSEISETDHAEKTIRLPKTYWCYRPGGPTPEVVPPPALSTGMITFGCLNQFQKLSRAAIEAWQQLMQAVPNSRLLLHAPAGSHCEELRRQFGLRGIAGDRIEFVDRLPWTQYIKLYERIDIALDTFPYVGGITSCDALWMGVPVITLKGVSAVNRGGASILRNLRLDELIADSPQSYVSTACSLSRDLPGLVNLRVALRNRMRASPLMDAFRFAGGIESAYLEMWSSWLKST